MFQLASVSKSLGGTLVAQQVGLGRVQWDTRLRSKLPWFALSDARASDEVTIADMYSHRSGLPLHAGDRVEDMGYDRRQVLERLRYQPLDPFRHKYSYTNFELTAGAEAYVRRGGHRLGYTSETALYQPLGRPARARASRTSWRGRTGPWGTSSKMGSGCRSAGARPRRAIGGGWRKLVGQRHGQLARHDARQRCLRGTTGDRCRGPRGHGVSVGVGLAWTRRSSGKLLWLRLQLGSRANGRHAYNHSGAFASGAGTHFKVVPSARHRVRCAHQWLSPRYPGNAGRAILRPRRGRVDSAGLVFDFQSLLPQGAEPEGSLVGVPPR